MRSTTGTELGVEYKKKQQILMSLALIRAVEGKVNVKGGRPLAPHHRTGHGTGGGEGGFS